MKINIKDVQYDWSAPDRTIKAYIVQLILALFLIASLVLMTIEMKKDLAIQNYLEIVFVKQQGSSTQYINEKYISLEEKFGTKSNFLKEVEAYKIEKGLTFSKSKVKKEYFLNH